MDYVRCAVWGMLYAEDACIVSRSLQGLAEMMEAIVEVCRAFALIVSAKKTETMCMTETGAILHLPRGRRDRNPSHVRRNRQADPCMLHMHQAVPT